MKMRAAPADAAFQHMRYPQSLPIWRTISFAAVIHDAGPADDFQVGDLRQLGQNVVLHTIGKAAACFFLRRLSFQTAERRFQLLPDAGSIHFSKHSIQQLRPVQSETPASNALVGLRRTHFPERVSSPVRRARMARPAQKRSRSSARAAAEG